MEAPLPGTEAPATVHTVLCVDDEPHVLSALRRALRAPGLQLLTAPGGAQALALLAEQPVDLVISDMRMPQMLGSELLARVQQGWPEIIRIVLTGQADLNDTIEAINRGAVFRYLQKPWNDDELRQVVRQGLEHLTLERERRALQALTQRQNEALRDANLLLEQRVAERTAQLAGAHEKLKHTYITSIQVFSNLLEQRSGRLVGHGRRVGDLARRIGRAMGCGAEMQQDLLVAGLLHDIGFIALPDHILLRPVARLADAELSQYRRHPLVGENALMALEDLRGVAALIHAHHERHDGKGFPDGLAGTAVPLGARILAVADTYDAVQHGLLVEATASEAQARALVRHGRGTQFDPEIVDVFLHITEPQRPMAQPSLRLGTAQLVPGMVLATELVSGQGLLMLTRGQVLSQDLIDRIRHLEARDGGPLVLNIRPGTGEPREDIAA